MQLPRVRDGASRLQVEQRSGGGVLGDHGGLGGGGVEFGSGSGSGVVLAVRKEALEVLGDLEARRERCPFLGRGGLLRLLLLLLYLGLLPGGAQDSAKMGLALDERAVEELLDIDQGVARDAFHVALDVAAVLPAAAAHAVVSAVGLGADTRVGGGIGVVERGIKLLHVDIVLLRKETGGNNFDVNLGLVDLGAL